MPHATVFFDITINGNATGRITMELTANTPITSEDFKALCTGEKGPQMTFKGTSFKRVIPGFMAQGDDFTLNEYESTELTSHLVKENFFKDENFINRHEGRGILSC